MITRLGVRARLSILVLLIFSASAVLGAWAMLSALEKRLLADARASAEAALTAYLDSLHTGPASVAVFDPAAATTFFYLDDRGMELTVEQYVNEILQSIGAVSDRGSSPSTSDALAFELAIDPETGEIVGPHGGLVTLSANGKVGDPLPIDRGVDVVAVAQEVTLPNGRVVVVGVSSPLGPITDGLDALAATLRFAIPLLIAVVGAIAWLVTGTALRPVQLITRQTRAITATNLSERVPIPAAKDDVSELARTMNEMLSRLENAQVQQHQFIADASHELRSPVAAARAQLEVANGGSDSEIRRAVTTALSEHESLSRLIDDLLALGRLDELGMGTPDRVDLSDLVIGEASRFHRPTVHLDVVSGVVAMGNRDLLVRAVRNVLENARRYADSYVALTLDEVGPEAVIHVDDDGPGVPYGQRDRIFDRFSRIDESRERSRGGAGLGLAIVREVVVAHRGVVEVSESSFGGARFTIRLPVG